MAFSLLMVASVPFLFDAPGSEDSKGTWIMACAVLSLPLTILVALGCAWVALPARRSRWWYAGLLAPGLSLVAFIIGGSMRPGFF